MNLDQDAFNLSITAIIPTYNRSRTVGRAIESILAQTCIPAEIIVVDDGSTDDTEQVVAKYPVRYMKTENRGVSHARNTGVELSSHPWIAFLDSDDIWMPEHIERMKRAMAETDGLAALYFSNVRLPQSRGRQNHWAYCGFEIEGEWQIGDGEQWAFMKQQPMTIPACVIKKRIYQMHRGFSPKLKAREDTMLFFILATHHLCCAVAGLGAVINEEDDIRLTDKYTARTLEYWQQTVYMFDHLFVNAGYTDKPLREARSDSYYNLSRVYLKNRSYFHFCYSIFYALYISPRVFFRNCIRTLKVNSFSAFRHTQ